MKWEEEEEQGDKANNGEERNSVLTPFRKEERKKWRKIFSFISFLAFARAPSTQPFKAWEGEKEEAWKKNENAAGGKTTEERRRQWENRSE